MSIALRTVSGRNADCPSAIADIRRYLSCRPRSNVASRARRFAHRSPIERCVVAIWIVDRSDGERRRNSPRRAEHVSHQVEAVSQPQRFHGIAGSLVLKIEAEPIQYGAAYATSEDRLDFGP
jgi:hypothetical protein